MTTTAPGSDGANAGEQADDLPPGALKVVLVDDDPRIRTLTGRLLRDSSAARLVGEAADGDAALELVRSTQPDVVLLDLLMPKVDGREILPRLVREAPRTMILVLSALTSFDEADETFMLGAFAYLEKTILGPQLAREIAELHELFMLALSGAKVWRPAGPPRVRR